MSTKNKKINPIPLVGDDQPYFDLVAKSKNSEEMWDLESEGQLSVDVLETPSDLIVRSAIAGVTPEDLDIHVTHDTLTIRGKREQCDEYPLADVHVEECHWGSFSRTIILPTTVAVDNVVATLKNGLLTILMPKTESSSNVQILDVD